MARYLLLKHYRTTTPTGAPDVLPLSDATPAEWQAHVAFMGDVTEMLKASGEFVDAQGLAPTGTFVRYGGPDVPPVVDGPFAETKELIAGWYAIDVDTPERAYEIAAHVSSAPGAGGAPIYEWIEVRPFMDEAPASFDEIVAQL